MTTYMFSILIATLAGDFCIAAPFVVETSTLYITSGYVGIGTTNPGALIDATRSGTNNYIRVKATATDRDAAFYSQDGTNTVVSGLMAASGCGAGNWGVYTTNCKMVITQGGSLGIGTTNPQSLLHSTGEIRISQAVSAAGSTPKLIFSTSGGTVNRAYVQGDVDVVGSLTLQTEGGQALKLNPTGGGPVGIGTTNPAYMLEVSSSVQVLYLYQTSDIALKENIKPLTNVLAKLKDIRGVSFDWNAKSEMINRWATGKSIGLIAQEVEKEFPEIVSTRRRPDPSAGFDYKKGPGGARVAVPRKFANYRSLDYGRFAAILLEAIKEQQVEIGQQQKRIAALEDFIQTLKR